MREIRAPHPERAGKTIAVPVPDAHELPPEINAEIENVIRVNAAYVAASLDATTKRNAIRTAANGERQKIAEAVAAGRKVPAVGDAEADAKLAATKADAHRDATWLALELAYGRYEEAMDANAPAWTDAALEYASRTREGFGASIEQMETARALNEEAQWRVRFFSVWPERAKPGAALTIDTTGISYPEALLGLKREAGLEAPEPRTLREKIVARGITPAPEVGGATESDEQVA